MGFIITLLCGALAGWLAGKLMNSEGSWLRNLIVGLAGGVVGSVVLGIVGIRGNGIIGGTVVSIIGACILIWLIDKMKS